MGWLDGALRIMPSWEFTGFGHTIPFEVFLPAVVFPGLIFTICFAVAGHRTPVHRRQRAAQPARPAAGPAQAHGRRRGDVRAALHALRGQLDRRAGQLLPRVAQRHAVVLPDRGVRRARSSRDWSPTSSARRCRVSTASASASGPSSCSRSAEGAYSTVPTAPRPDDVHDELDPEPVPERIDIEPLSNGGTTRARELADGRAPGHTLSRSAGPAHRPRPLGRRRNRPRRHLLRARVPRRAARRRASGRSGPATSPAGPRPSGGSGPARSRAAFFNFHPAMVARAVPGCWDVAAPGDAVPRAGHRRGRGAGRGLQRRGALRRSGRRCRSCGAPWRAATAPGRVLAASQPLAVARRRAGPGHRRPRRGLAGRAPTLREHRGDGHVAALVGTGLGGPRGAPAGRRAPRASRPRCSADNRGWSEEDWERGHRRVWPRAACCTPTGAPPTPAGRCTPRWRR